MTAITIFAILLSQSSPTLVTPRLMDFDIAKLPTTTTGCAERGKSDEIVVCAPKGMDIWIADAGRFAPKPLKAEFIGPMKAETAVHVVQHGSPTGAAPAAVVTFKWRF